MHSRLAAQPLDGSVQGIHAPDGNLIHEGIEGRFIEQNDVNAQRFKLPSLFVQKCCKGHGHFRPAAIMGVGDGIANGHRAGQGKFELVCDMFATKFRALSMHGFFTLNRRCHCRHLGVIPVIANAHGGHALPVDAVNIFQKSMHEMFAELLAVTDDINPRIFLAFNPGQGRILLARNQIFPFQAPGSPQRLRFRQPSRFRQTARYCRCDHRISF